MTQTNMPGLMPFSSGTGSKDRMQTSVGLFSGVVDLQEAQQWISAFSQALQPIAHPNESENPLQQETASTCGKKDTANTTMQKRVRRGEESLLHVLGGLALQPMEQPEPNLQPQLRLGDDPTSLSDGSKGVDVLPKEGVVTGILSPQEQATDAGSKNMAANPEAVPVLKVAEVRLREGEVKATGDNVVSMENPHSVVIDQEKKVIPPDSGATKSLKHVPWKGSSEEIGSVQVLSSTQEGSTSKRVVSYEFSEPMNLHQDQWFHVSTEKASTQGEIVDSAIPMLQGKFSERDVLEEGVQGKKVQEPEKVVQVDRNRSTVGRTDLPLNKQSSIIGEGGSQSVDIAEDAQKPFFASAENVVHEVPSKVDVEDIRLFSARASMQNTTVAASIPELQGEVSGINSLVKGVQGNRLQDTDRRQTSFYGPLQVDAPNSLLNKEIPGVYAFTNFEESSANPEKMDLSDEETVPVGRTILPLEARNVKKDENFFGLVDFHEILSKPEITSGGKPVDAVSPPVDVEGIPATIRNAVLQHSKGTSEMRISLKPEWLGSMTMRIEMAEGKVQVHIATEHQESRDLIQSQVPILRNELEGKGLVVETIRVEVSGGRAENHSGAAMGQWASQRDGHEPERAFVRDSIESTLNEKQEAPYPSAIMETIPKGRLSAFA